MIFDICFIADPFATLVTRVTEGGRTVLRSTYLGPDRQ